MRGLIEDRMRWLDVDSIDIAFVYDLSPSLAFFPALREEQYKIA